MKSFFSFSFLTSSVIAVLIAICAMASTPVAAEKSPLFDRFLVKGTDTIVVGGNLGPETVLFPEIQKLDEAHYNRPPDPAVSVIQDLFAKDPTVSVKDARDLPIKQWYSPRVLVLAYTVSAQQEILDGKNIKIASIGLRLSHLHEGGTESVIPLPPVTYPFILPDTEEEYFKKVETGIRYLASYLPSYIRCGIDVTGRCVPDDAFEDTIYRPCKPPVMRDGKLMPVPCRQPKKKH